MKALDTGNGVTIEHDAHSRYAMCSTFKLALAAAILAQVDVRQRKLTDELAFDSSVLLRHAPVVRANLDQGRLSLETLARASVRVSDNSAANLLLEQIGGPPGFTRFLRRCGDSVSRLDRNEPMLNENLPGDPRDTTTPAAMLDLMHALLIRNVLAPASRSRLIHWMEESTTGLTRLRAGLPLGWRVGDKTGTSDNDGANNDIAIVLPPDRAAILVTSYITGGTASSEARNAAHASVARTIAARLS